jgi:hypothetical protein
MLRKPYESYLAACPYYMREDALHVFCAGWREDVNLTISFPSAGEAKAHKEACCRSLSGCTDCPVHQMVSFELSGEEKKTP